MSGSIVQAVARIKCNVAEFLTAESIVAACREAGHRWRERELGPAATVWAFLLQVLYGNTSCAHVVRLAKLRCSAEAYCAARARLPLAAIESLLSRTTAAARRGCREPRWHGHRTFFADGSGCSTPDTPELQRHFGQPGQQRRGCGFPQVHLLAMFDAEEYPATELASLYRCRWEIETNFAHLKTTMRMDVLRCQSVPGVLKELAMFALVYNLVRLVMLSAARTMEVAVERISFVDALRWLAQAGADTLPPIVRINRLRPNRCEPRVRKRRPKEFTLMNSPRCKLRQQLLAKRVRA